MNIWIFYRDLISRNFVWVKRILIWAGVWLLLGFAAYLTSPDLLEKVSRLLDEVFREILGGEELVLNLNSALLIFRNNFFAALLAMFLGVIFGLIPLLAVALNFFILGFLWAVFSFGQHLPGQNWGVLLFFASVLPHGILEIPALLLASAFGWKLGFSWKRFGRSFMENLQLLPLVVILLFLAALVEIFVSGHLVSFLMR